MVRSGPPEPRLVWDCDLDRSGLEPTVLALRDALADAVEQGHWAHVATLLDRTDEDLPSALSANAMRAGDRAGMAPLHHAAVQGAHPDVVDDLIGRGAWRTLRTAEGDTAADLARRIGHDELAERLRPHPALEMDAQTCADLETFLYALFQVRTRRLGRVLRAPQVGPLLEHPDAIMWIGVRGMYGGFACRWAEDVGEPTLEVRSRSRVVGGSGRTHHITVEGIERVTHGLF